MMRFVPMQIRHSALLAIALSALPLAACKREAPEPAPSETPAVATPVPAPLPTTPPSSEPAPIPSETPVAQADKHGDPAAILQGYAAALHARDWNRAAKAWGRNSGVTPAILKAAYDRPQRPNLEIGKGEQEGAAGSLYYEAPVVLRFGGDAVPEKGTLTLKRVNDVDGATPEQLRWHIERATIGVGQ